MTDDDDFIDSAKELADTFSEELSESFAIPGLILTLVIVGKVIHFMYSQESNLRKKQF